MRKVILFVLITALVLLAGCWDQHLLVNKTLVNGISFDVTEEDKILGTVRVLNIQSKGGGQFEIKDELVESVRPTTVGLGIDINSKSEGEIDFSKAHIILIGEELAKKGVHPYIEPFYRSKDSYITSKIVITKGKAIDILSMEKEKSPIAFFILKTIHAAEVVTLLPDETTFSVWTKILDPGKDIILPFIEGVDSDKIAIAGVALFNGDKFSGKTLSKQQSSLLLLLLDRLKKTNNMALLLNQNSKEQSISFSTRKVKREMEVKVDKNSKKVSSAINLTIQIEVNSFPQEFNKEMNIKKLNKDLSVELTKQAKEIINILLQANCDAFGIGRKISSSHPDLWEKINWDEEYKNVQIDPKVKVQIIKTGNVF